MGILNTIIENLPIYLLAFVRIASMFMLSPIFGRKNIPQRYKAGFSLAVTILLVPIITQQITDPQIALSLDNNVSLEFVVNVFKELMVGALLGFVTLIFLNIAATAGQVIDVSMGLGIGSVFDPQTNMQMPLSGALLNTAIFIYFILANGHLRLIQILNLTFVTAPIGQVSINADLLYLIVEQFILTFSLAVTLMIPVIAITFIIEVGMGILTRAIPQLHAYLVGIPLKIIVGFTVLLFLQPVYINFCDNVFDRLYFAAENLAYGLGR